MSLVLCLLVEFDMTGGGVATLRKQPDSPELELCEGGGRGCDSTQPTSQQISGLRLAPKIEALC